MSNWHDNVPAPTDANGHEVPLDTRELVYRGETREVYGFSYSIALRVWHVQFEGYGVVVLNTCTLPDSWERLEKDARKDACEYFCRGDSSICNKCQSCPAYGDDCGPAMAQDVFRRAKALAGVTDGE